MSSDSSNSQQDWSYRALFWFSLPSIMASLLEPLAGVVDTALVGRLDTLWLAALAIAVTILSSFTWMFNFLLHASTHAISRSYSQGGGDSDHWRQVAEKIVMSLLLALGVGVFASACLLLFRPLLYSLAGADAQLSSLVDEYFYIRVAGHTLTILYGTTLSLIRGLGDVRFSFWLVGVTTGLNVLLSWLFLYPLEMGLAGAAWGTVLSNLLGLLIGLWWIAYSRAPLRRSFFPLSLAPRSEWFRFGRNSGNLFGRSILLSSSLFVAMRVAREIGVTELAAHQIMLQLWLFASFFTDGVAISANILGARLVAQKNSALLSLVFRRLLVMGGMIGVSFTFVYLLGQAPLTALFTNDPQVILILLSMWPFICFSQLPNALAFVYDGLIFGLERFDFLRRHMLWGVVIIFIPIMGWAFATKSLMFLWWGLIALNIYRGVSGYWCCRRELARCHESWSQ